MLGGKGGTPVITPKALQNKAHVAPTLIDR